MSFSSSSSLPFRSTRTLLVVSLLLLCFCCSCQLGTNNRHHHQHLFYGALAQQQYTCSSGSLTVQNEHALGDVTVNGDASGCNITFRDVTLNSLKFNVGTPTLARSNITVTNVVCNFPTVATVVTNAGKWACVEFAQPLDDMGSIIFETVRFAQVRNSINDHLSNPLLLSFLSTPKLVGAVHGVVRISDFDLSSGMNLVQDSKGLRFVVWALGEGIASFDNNHAGAMTPVGSFEFDRIKLHVSHAISRINTPEVWIFRSAGVCHGGRAFLWTNIDLQITDALASVLDQGVVGIYAVVGDFQNRSGSADFIVENATVVARMETQDNNIVRVADISSSSSTMEVAGVRDLVFKNVTVETRLPTDAALESASTGVGTIPVKARGAWSIDAACRFNRPVTRLRDVVVASMRLRGDLVSTYRAISVRAVNFLKGVTNVRGTIEFSDISIDYAQVNTTKLGGTYNNDVSVLVLSVDGGSLMSFSRNWLINPSAANETGRATTTQLARPGAIIMRGVTLTLGTVTSSGRAEILVAHVKPTLRDMVLFEQSGISVRVSSSLSVDTDPQVLVLLQTGNVGGPTGDSPETEYIFDELSVVIGDGDAGGGGGGDVFDIKTQAPGGNDEVSVGIAVFNSLVDHVKTFKATNCSVVVAGGVNTRGTAIAAYAFSFLDTVRRQTSSYEAVARFSGITMEWAQQVQALAAGTTVDVGLVYVRKTLQFLYGGVSFEDMSLELGEVRAASSLNVFVVYFEMQGIAQFATPQLTLRNTSIVATAAVSRPNYAGWTVTTGAVTVSIIKVEKTLKTDNFLVTDATVDLSPGVLCSTTLSIDIVRIVQSAQKQISINTDKTTFELLNGRIVVRDSRSNGAVRITPLRVERNLVGYANVTIENIFMSLSVNSTGNTVLIAPAMVDTGFDGTHNLVLRNLVLRDLKLRSATNKIDVFGSLCTGQTSGFDWQTTAPVRFLFENIHVHVIFAEAPNQQVKVAAAFFNRGISNAGGNDGPRNADFSELIFRNVSSDCGRLSSGLHCKFEMLSAENGAGATPGMYHWTTLLIEDVDMHVDSMSTSTGASKDVMVSLIKSDPPIGGDNTVTSAFEIRRVSIRAREMVAAGGSVFFQVLSMAIVTKTFARVTWDEMSVEVKNDTTTTTGAGGGGGGGVAQIAGRNGYVALRLIMLDDRGIETVNGLSDSLFRLSNISMDIQPTIESNNGGWLMLMSTAKLRGIHTVVVENIAFNARMEMATGGTLECYIFQIYKSIYQTTNLFFRNVTVRAGARVIGDGHAQTRLFQLTGTSNFEDSAKILKISDVAFHVDVESNGVTNRARVEAIMFEKQMITVDQAEVTVTNFSVTGRVRANKNSAEIFFFNCEGFNRNWAAMRFHNVTVAVAAQSFRDIQAYVLRLNTGTQPTTTTTNAATAPSPVLELINVTLAGGESGAAATNMSLDPTSTGASGNFNILYFVQDVLELRHLIVRNCVMDFPSVDAPDKVEFFLINVPTSYRTEARTAQLVVDDCRILLGTVSAKRLFVTLVQEMNLLPAMLFSSNSIEIADAAVDEPTVRLVVLSPPVPASSTTAAPYRLSFKGSRIFIKKLAPRVAADAGDVSLVHTISTTNNVEKIAALEHTDCSIEIEELKPFHFPDAVAGRKVSVHMFEVLGAFEASSSSTSSPITFIRCSVKTFIDYMVKSDTATPLGLTETISIASFGGLISNVKFASFRECSMSLTSFFKGDVGKLLTDGQYFRSAAILNLHSTQQQTTRLVDMTVEIIGCRIYADLRPSLYSPASNPFKVRSNNVALASIAGGLEGATLLVRDSEAEANLQFGMLYLDPDAVDPVFVQRVVAVDIPAMGVSHASSRVVLERVHVKKTDWWTQIPTAVSAPTANSQPSPPNGRHLAEEFVALLSILNSSTSATTPLAGSISVSNSTVDCSSLDHYVQEKISDLGRRQDQSSNFLLLTIHPVFIAVGVAPDDVSITMINVTTEVPSTFFFAESVDNQPTLLRRTLVATGCLALAVPMVSTRVSISRCAVRGIGLGAAMLEGSAVATTEAVSVDVVGAYRELLADQNGDGEHLLSQQTQAQQNGNMLHLEDNELIVQGLSCINKTVLPTISYTVTHLALLQLHPSSRPGTLRFRGSNTLRLREVCLPLVAAATQPSSSSSSSSSGGNTASHASVVSFSPSPPASAAGNAAMTRPLKLEQLTLAVDGGVLVAGALGSCSLVFVDSSSYAPTLQLFNNTLLVVDDEGAKKNTGGISDENTFITAFVSLVSLGGPNVVPNHTTVDVERNKAFFLQATNSSTIVRFRLLGTMQPVTTSSSSSSPLTVASAGQQLRLSEHPLLQSQLAAQLQHSTWRILCNDWPKSFSKDSVLTQFAQVRFLCSITTSRSRPSPTPDDTAELTPSLPPSRSHTPTRTHDVTPNSPTASAPSRSDPSNSAEHTRPTPTPSRSRNLTESASLSMSRMPVCGLLTAIRLLPRASTPKKAGFVVQTGEAVVLLEVGQRDPNDYSNFLQGLSRDPWTSFASSVTHRHHDPEYYHDGGRTTIMFRLATFEERRDNTKQRPQQQVPPDNGNVTIARVYRESPTRLRLHLRVRGASPRKSIAISIIMYPDALACKLSRRAQLKSIDGTNNDQDESLRSNQIVFERQAPALSADFVQAARTGGTVTSFVSAFAMRSPAGLLSMQRSQNLLDSFGCARGDVDPSTGKPIVETEDEPYELFSSPTNLEVSGASGNRFSVGTVVGNTVIIVGMVVVSLIIAGAAMMFSSQSTKRRRTRRRSSYDDDAEDSNFTSTPSDPPPLLCGLFSAKSLGAAYFPGVFWSAIVPLTDGFITAGVRLTAFLPSHHGGADKGLGAAAFIIVAANLVYFGNMLIPRKFFRQVWQRAVNPPDKVRRISSVGEKLLAGFNRLFHSRAEWVERQKYVGDDEKNDDEFFNMIVLAVDSSPSQSTTDHHTSLLISTPHHQQQQQQQQQQRASSSNQSPRANDDEDDQNDHRVTLIDVMLGGGAAAVVGADGHRHHHADSLHDEQSRRRRLRAMRLPRTYHVERYGPLYDSRMRMFYFADYAECLVSLGISLCSVVMKSADIAGCEAASVFGTSLIAFSCALSFQFGYTCAIDNLISIVNNVMLVAIALASCVAAFRNALAAAAMDAAEYLAVSMMMFTFVALAIRIFKNIDEWAEAHAPNVRRKFWSSFKAIRKPLERRRKM